MSDLISRQDAVDAAIEMFKAWYGGSVLRDREIRVRFDALPSAQERKKGKWVEEDDAIIHGHCSNCGWISIWQETDVFGMNYCPNCGADMRGEENGKQTSDI